MTRLAIMQPYFLPYIGYFQLIAAADLFIVYDNIKYTKKGWINRNRLLLNAEPTTFSLPLKNASDSLHVDQRVISEQFNASKLLNQFKAAYGKAPYVAQTMPLLESILCFTGSNLFDFLLHGLNECCRKLGIHTPIRRSSEIAIDHTLTAQNKVLALCQACGAQQYINAIGGVELYDHSDFDARRIELQFIRSQLVPYQQFGGVFVPWLSIIDHMMFQSTDQLSRALRQYDII